jgi:AAA family ATP:ADP antiporter
VLDLEPRERRSAIGLAWLMLLVSAATKLGDGVVTALFLERVGAEWLPGLFALNAVLDVAGGALYLRLARGRPHGSFFVALLACTAVLTLGLRVLLVAAHPAVFFAAYALHGVATMVGALHWGTFLLDFFEQSRAGRVFPVVYSGARVGGIAGGLLLAVLAPVGAENLLVGVALLQGAAALLTGQLARGVPEVRAAHAGEGAFAELRHGLGLARASPLLRALAAGAIAMVLVRMTLRYLSGDALSSEMGEAELARFLGQYTAVANGVGFVFQVLLMPRLVARIGVAGANLAYAFLCVAALGGMAASHGVWTAAAARLVDAELKDALKTPLSALFYGALPAAERARGRAFVLGLAVPAGAIAGGLALQGLTHLPARTVAFVGLGLGLVFVAATAVQNRGYRAALKARLADAPESSPQAQELARALEEV